MGTYTVDQVDELIRTLEKGAERQVATAHSAVKGVAAERDLLSAAETARDLLVKCVKGEKELLNKVFGANNCERIGRLRLLLDSVQLSDMHVKDPRWKNLREIVETIEAVLKDLGTFKPWVPPTVGKPEKIAYRGLRRRLSPGRRVNLKPEIEGGEVKTFEVDPPLPPSLEISPTTGAITGSLTPGQLVDETTYVVTARNDAGQATVDLIFAVKEAPPHTIVYTGVHKNILSGEAVRWEPVVEGGYPTEWSVEPALPEGLQLDRTTGVVRGAVVLADGVEPTTYQVSASNSGGQATVSLQFGVRSAPPKTPVYNVPDNAVFAVGEPIELVPEATPGSVFSIKPDLPPGLTIDEATGVISGTPTMPVAMTEYKVKAKTAGGEAKATLNFAIQRVAPTELSYPSLTSSLLSGYDVTHTPQVAGKPTAWTVEPALPAGMTLDPATGVISGAPQEVQSSGTWTVSAENAAGRTSCEISFGVELAPPASLSFPTLPKQLDLDVPMRAEPSVKGQVEEFTVTPELPAGLQMDSRTGVIEGTPTEVSPATEYTITARNSTGETSSKLTFAVARCPPSALSYPTLEPVLSAGKGLLAHPDVSGVASSFKVEPPLPQGMKLNRSTGIIEGAPKGEKAETTYTITASNEAGETSAKVTFKVALPAPSEFSYPALSSAYAVGEPVSVEPQLEGGLGCKFRVEPALPEGMLLDPNTGVISGTPEALSEETVYVVTARNPSGEASTEVAFEVVETLKSDDVAGSIHKEFVAKLDAVEDIAELMPEPSRTKEFGDWMIWMVHRAYLNDPSLTDFNFNNMHMPPPHIEARIAPKLMKAMETNTYIEVLSLVNSNLMKAQGSELCAALRTNEILKVLYLEANNLDSITVREIAEAIMANKRCQLDHLRLAPQKQVGSFFGRPVEEAIGMMMEKNETIVKLGFECNDPHWRNSIDRALLRNNDYSRRKRRRSSAPPEEVVAEEKALSRLVLREPPKVPVTEVFNQDADPNYPVFLKFVADKKRLPIVSQLQSYAKSEGTSLKYSAVAPLIKTCRARLLDVAVGQEVTVADIFEVDSEGDMRNWSENNGNWSVDIFTPDNKRYVYRSKKEPAFHVSDAWAAWLKAEPASSA